MAGRGSTSEAARERTARLLAQMAPVAAATAGSSGRRKTAAPPVTHTADVCIVGAGVLGAALAAVLGRKGYTVVVLERDWSEPNRIVGELLQPGGLRVLRELGLGEAVEGIDGQAIEGYGVFYGEEAVRLPYPPEAGEAPMGIAFHHGRFVMGLRKAAREAPGVTALAATVNRMWEDEEGTVLGVDYTSKDDGSKGRINAWLTIACDGFASRARKLLTKTKPAKTSTFLALELEDVELPFPNSGHVILADPSPILCYPIGSREARMLIDIPNSVPGKEYGEYVRAMTEQMPPALRAGALAALEKSPKLRTMPNSYLPAVPERKLGAIALGDSFNMRHPLTGAGMTVALADGKLLVELLGEVDDLSDRKATAKKLKSFYTLRKEHASTANVLANALYAVFAARDNEYLPFMQDACFEYFKLNRITRDGTMSLLGLLDTRPYVLVSHFFAVAAYAIVKTVLPLPYPTRIAQAFHILMSATRVIKPLLDNENVTALALLPNSLLGIEASISDFMK
ncbi:squalene epoxidase [Thecamonas trahens ATCC 50062]|uniref:Squalene monooxygenase n=1 Tax=Thecamonas trahens ATCC 50062 TaxID=461836 RepID=A0A0L0DJS8_THETB|nr:squalene epoxidase [Thecamonas trahens ATCC 50062]KNC52664.1 squalene epoxidase [Thecamonas trahens ATCC 50062]|eukprot:XP_013755214.1 squalene epoxidase [Thecamonas trahens ATCC 50062]